MGVFLPQGKTFLRSSSIRPKKVGFAEKPSPPKPRSQNWERGANAFIEGICRLTGISHTLGLISAVHLVIARPKLDP